MRDFTRIPIRLDRLLLVKKTALADGLFHFGLVLAFFESLHPWFLWPLGPYAYLITSFCMGGTYLLDMSRNQKNVDSNRRFLLPWITYTMLSVLIFFVNPDATFMAFISVALQLFSYYVIFKAGGERMRKSLSWASRCHAIIIAVSYVGFMMYLFGFSLPSSSLVYGDNIYSFSNYYFFLLADADMWTLIPRFQAVFLEPSHMAIASVFLLMLEIGLWKKWYNLILLFSVAVSFSLEAYVLLFCLFFLRKWIMGQNVVRGLMIIIAATATIVIGSFFYNDGDNMVNSLIVARLEIEDGEMAGNNRTTDTFDAEFDSFMNSNDIYFGRTMYEHFGNSGYKVFIYRNGLVSLLLLFIFYVVILHNPRNRKASLTAWCLTFIHFVVRAHMTWASCILPMYSMAQWFEYLPQKKKAEDERSTLGQ